MRFYAEIITRELYAITRQSLFLGRLEILDAPPEYSHAWMAQHRKCFSLIMF